MGVNRTSKMLAYVNYRMRVTILDGRQIVGRFMAFDRHMNLVLADAEEFRKLPPKKGLSEEDRHTRRVLGFLLLRGEEVVSLTVEGPPPQEDKRAQQAPAGPGSGRAAGARHAGRRPRHAPSGPRGARARRRRTRRRRHATPVCGGARDAPAPGRRPGRAPRDSDRACPLPARCPRIQTGHAPAGNAPPGFRPGPPGPPPS